MNEILIVEDEISISDLIKIGLEANGYKCEVAQDGEIAANMLENKIYDLVLLDIMLPKIDGYELLKYIKQVSDIPIIFITAKTQTKDIIKGLKIGADDYITKPFETEELLARVEAVLRRYNKVNENIKIDNVTINTASRTVKIENEKIELTPKEFELLILFVQNKNVALYRSAIFEKIWGEDLFFSKMCQWN